MKRRCAPIVLAALTLAAPAPAAPPRVLFDNTHAETAGNADWIIDTDQPLPAPDQSTVTASTPRTYWLGAISSFGIDLVKRGAFVATLTPAYGITYGNASNPYDLSAFDLFVVPEPNTRFSAAESTAIFDFVRDGGGLIAISDHYNSDRNNDGIDSPGIWNALDAQHLWGVRCAVSGDANNNIVETSTNVATAPDDSLIHGPVGTVTGLAFHNGTTFTLDPAINPTVRGEVWMTGVLRSSTTGVMAASAVYGNGRVFYVGDSSPVDDGSAQSGNSSIYDGWGEAGATDSTLFMNAALWAARRAAPLAVGPQGSELALARPAPNPARSAVRFAFTLPTPGTVRLDLIDLAGRHVATLARGWYATGSHALTWDARDAGGGPAPAGIYFVRLAAGSRILTTRFVLMR